MLTETVKLTGTNSAGELLRVTITTETIPPTLFGADPHTIDLTRYPGLAYNRIYSSSSAIPSIAAIPAGVTPHVSFAATPVPATVNAWLDTLNRPVFLTDHHEPEKKLTPAAYQADWHALAALVDAHPNGRYVALVEILTRYYQVHNTDNWQSFWTGKAGIMGWDCYLESNSTAYPDPATFFAPMVTAANAVGAQFMVPEFGFVPMAFDPDGSGAAAWLTACAEYLQSVGCVAVGEWDNPAGADGNVLTGKPLAAWQAVVAG